MLTREDIPDIFYQPVTNEGVSTALGAGPVSAIINMAAELETMKWRVANLPIEMILENERNQCSVFWHASDKWAKATTEKLLLGPLGTRRINALRTALNDLVNVLSQNVRDFRTHTDWENHRNRILEQIRVSYIALQRVAETLDGEFLSTELIQSPEAWRAA